MSGDFSLKYNSEGTITYLSTFVYGKDKSGKDITCLIYYDRDISKDIRIRVNGYAEPTYSNSKLVQPLIETVDAIQLEKLAIDWKSKEYSLHYKGKVTQGYNTDGIVNINELGVEDTLYMAINEIIGYTVSISAPGNVEKKYNLICDSKWSKPENLTMDDSSEGEAKEEVNDKEQFYLSKDVGYRLNFEDAAAGSTFYSLSKTSDGGQSWEIINENPFGGVIGGASGIVFINEEVGFMGASRNGGSNGELYRSVDGGKSFSMVNFIPYEVTLENGASFSPYDSPEMPYEEDGVLKVLLGQGADYNGNSKALYQSKDNGQTWEFIKEVKVEEESVD